MSRLMRNPSNADVPETSMPPANAISASEKVPRLLAGPAGGCADIGPKLKLFSATRPACPRRRLAVRAA